MRLPQPAGAGAGDLVGLFAGHNFALKGLKPLLEALGPGGSEIAAAGPFIFWSAAAANGRLPPAGDAGSGSRHGPFPGFLSRRQTCYWSSDFFVQPTYYDPCSLVVLEALACGLPVITTAQNGASEMLTDGREGYILTAPDAQGELIAALDHMTDDAAPASDVGQAVAARPASRRLTCTSRG